MPALLLLTEEDVRQVLTMEMALEAVENGLRKMALDEAQNVSRARTQTDHAMLHVMSAAAKSLGFMGYKTYATTRKGQHFHVGLFDGKTGALARSFFAFEPDFRGGIFVASADVNHDGFADIIVGAASNGHVKVFDGKTGALFFSQFVLPGTSGAISVAAGDLNGDGFADLIVGAASSTTNSQVTILDGNAASTNKLSMRNNFNPFAGFTGLVRVGTVDRSGDLLSNLVVGAGPGADPHVAVFDGVTLAATLSFDAFGSFSGGVFVSNAGH